MSVEMYNRMKKGQKEAKIGLNSEKDIVMMINTDEKFQSSLRRCLTHLGFNPRKIAAHEDGIKADIIIEMGDGDKIGVSIKSSTGTSFHNLDRRWLDKWKDFLDMPDSVFRTIKEAILRVAKDKRSKFILEADRDLIRDFFAEHLEVIIREIFRRGEEHLKLFMVNDKRKRSLYVFNMDDVIDFLVKDATDISFTSKGIIKLGSFITVQRKGGNT